MSKAGRSLAGVAAVTAGGILLIAWLQSSPQCDTGCQNQLEHLKDHIVADLVKVLIAQIGL